MGCPSDVKIGDDLTFTITTHDPDTGVVTDADSAPTYRVYEDETATAILNGTMAKLDDTNTTGFYSESIACTSGNGFEDSKTYSIYIEATVDSDKGAISYTFKAHDHDVTSVVSALTQYIVHGNVAYDDTGDNLYIIAWLEKNGEIVSDITSGTAIVYNASGTKQDDTLSDNTPDARGILSFTQATTSIVHDEVYYVQIAIVYSSTTYTGEISFTTAD